MPYNLPAAGACSWPAVHSAWQGQVSLPDDQTEDRYSTGTAAAEASWNASDDALTSSTAQQIDQSQTMQVYAEFLLPIHKARSHTTHSELLEVARRNAVKINRC